MIVDSSALIAILRAEPDAAVFADALAASDLNWLSAADFVEAAAVVDAGGNAVASRASMRC